MTCTVGAETNEISAPDHESLLLGTLVPNSRDRHENNGDRILRATKHTLKSALFEKTD